MIDIKTKLQDDPVIFSNYDSMKLGRKIYNLNKLGIYTVEDLINFNEIDFPLSSKKLYTSIANILRHEYLDQELVYDVLLDREYLSEKFYDICYEDITNLGLLTTRDKKKEEHEIYFLCSCFKNPFTLSDFLEACINKKYGFRTDFLDPALSVYYSDYIRKKKQDEVSKNETIFNKDDEINELSALKIQLQTLISIDKNLQNQINSLQEQIDAMEKGDHNLG